MISYLFNKLFVANIFHFHLFIIFTTSTRNRVTIFLNTRYFSVKNLDVFYKLCYHHSNDNYHHYYLYIYSYIIIFNVVTSLQEDENSAPHRLTIFIHPHYLCNQFNLLINYIHQHPRVLDSENVSMNQNSIT